jgi:hypothetical protein
VFASALPSAVGAAADDAPAEGAAPLADDAAGAAPVDVEAPIAATPGTDEER